MAEAVAAPPAALVGQELDLGRVARWGLFAGLGGAFVSIIGMVEAFSERSVIDPILSLGYVVLLWLPLVFGYQATYRPALEGVEGPRPGLYNVVGGALSGLVGGGVMVLLLLLIDNIALRDIFPNISPRLFELLTFERGLGFGVLAMLGGAMALGALGGALHLPSDRMRRALASGLLWILVVGFVEVIIGQITRETGLGFLDELIYSSERGLTWGAAIVVGLGAFGLSYALGARRQTLRGRLAELPQSQRRRIGLVAAMVFIALGFLLPTILGSFLNEILATVGLFLLLGLGLNIVVGFAGLLDLGYVAFFAVGAYSMAVLTSPGSPQFSPELTFWLAIPFVILAATAAGIFVGTPVIRMRGDYLAIVTLGFGEIARILFLSDWFKPVFGGAQGILQIPSIELGPVTIRGTNTQAIFYMIFAFVLVAAYVSWRLQDSRIGRAWMAMREDEHVAEAMGINIVTTKLLAFVIGAIIASFGGALFAVKIGSIFPNSFALIVSIIVLVLIIVGGMGNIPGVAIGAFVLIGVLGGPTQPGLLREFEEYKLLLYGALLVYMMLKRPEGLLPSTRRAQELHQEEFLQDAWLKTQAGEEPAPAEVS